MREQGGNEAQSRSRTLACTSFGRPSARSTSTPRRIHSTPHIRNFFVGGQGTMSTTSPKNAGIFPTLVFPSSGSTSYSLPDPPFPHPYLHTWMRRGAKGTMKRNLVQERWFILQFGLPVGRIHFVRLVQGRAHDCKRLAVHLVRRVLEEHYGDFPD
jgi:hypothetical protein